MTKELVNISDENSWPPPNKFVPSILVYHYLLPTSYHITTPHNRASINVGNGMEESQYNSVERLQPMRKIIATMTMKRTRRGRIASSASKMRYHEIKV